MLTMSSQIIMLLSIPNLLPSKIGVSADRPSARINHKNTNFLDHVTQELYFIFIKNWLCILNVYVCLVSFCFELFVEYVSDSIFTVECLRKSWPMDLKGTGIQVCKMCVLCLAFSRTSYLRFEFIFI